MKSGFSTPASESEQTWVGALILTNYCDIGYQIGLGDQDRNPVYLEMRPFLRADTIISYRTSLNAKRNAAVMALWVTFGPIPDYHILLVNSQPVQFAEFLTLIEPLPAFFPNNSFQTSIQALLGTILASNMCPALNGDIRVGDAGRQDLA